MTVRISPNGAGWWRASGRRENGRVRGPVAGTCQTCGVVVGYAALFGAVAAGVEAGQGRADELVCRSEAADGLRVALRPVQSRPVRAS